MVEIIDRFLDAFQVLTSDWGRFGAIFLVTAIIFGCILIADAVIPSFGLGLTHGITISCVGVKVPYIFPLFTHLTNMAVGVIPIQCAVDTVNMGALVAYYLQIQALVFLGVIIGIIALNLSG